MERINPYLNNIAYYLVLIFALVLILSNALATTLAGIIVLIWLAQALAYRRKAWLKFPLFKPILALIGFKMIVLAVMGYAGNFGRVLDQLTMPLIYFTLPAIVVTAERRRRVIWLIISGAILASGIGIIKYILGIEPRITSIVSGIFTLGAFLTIVFGILLAMFTFAKSFKEHFFLLLVSIPIFVGVILTYMRSGYLAVVASVLSVGIFKARKLLLLALIMIGGLVIISPSTTRSVFDRFNFHIEGALADRDFLFAEAVKQAQNLGFFGNGINSFKELPQIQEYNRVGAKHITNSHSMYFEPLLDGGPLLLAITLSIFFIQGRFSWALYRKSRDPEQKLFQLGILLVVLNLIIMGFFADPFKDPILEMLIWLLFGLSLV